MTAPGILLDVWADYALSRDGYLFGRIFKVNRKGIDEGPTAGELFSFSYAVKDKRLSITELKGTEATMEAQERSRVTGLLRRSHPVRGKPDRVGER